MHIDAEGVDDVGDVARVRASGPPSADSAAADAAALFDFERPTGTIIDTGSDGPPWVEVTFARPLTVTRLRLRNVADETARSARGLRVEVKGRWRSRTVYDGGAQRRAWRALVTEAQAAAAAEPETVALLDVLDLTVRGEYARAHTALASKVADEALRVWFRGAVNEVLLPARGREWTVHGPQRPFRLWGDAERVDYVRDSALVVEALRSLTPNVCLGFGSVLAVVRDHALIPHDDDIDVIVGFEPTEAATLTDALRLVETHMRPLGFDVTGTFAAHRHVRRPGRKRVDVFVGLFEGEAVSWYPGARGGLTRAIVFPPGSADLLGVTCAIPVQPEVYLERLYGEGWRVPDPYFSHAWNVAAYADIRGAPVATGATEAPAAEPERRQQPSRTPPDRGPAPGRYHRAMPTARRPTGARPEALFQPPPERQPLAARMRPRDLEEFVGQDHLVGERGPLRRSVARGHLSSILLWGPPGTGKTTLARLLADAIGAEFVALSAVMSGVADVRAHDRRRRRSGWRSTGRGPSCSSTRSIASTRPSRTPCCRMSRTARSR